MKETRPKIAHLAACFSLAVCSACGPGEELAEDVSNVTGVGGETVDHEDNDANNGRYPEVLHVLASGGCTGTIVGPYTVLTAHHCWNGTSSIWVRYKDEGYFSATRAYLNPYLDESHHPDWWAALNDAQMAAPGGRQDDWPAQHDHLMLFVPGLTPEWLAERDIEPARIDPYADADLFRLVGVGSTTNGNSRDSADTVFRTATANTITGFPRDGYLTRDHTGFGSYANHGDSGGSSLGTISYSGWSSGPFDGPRHVLGTAQNGLDLAPLAYDPGISMTPNQRLTVRLNHLWASARRNDIDGDGLPTLCDPDPASDANLGNLCPDAIGSPTTNTDGIPIASLTCAPGYFAVGYKGRRGDLVDQLAVKCRALSCLVANLSSCSDEYWTDHFGGNGGSAFTSVCPNGSVMTGIYGKHTSSTLRMIRGRCHPFNNVRVESTASTSYLAFVGNQENQQTTGSWRYSFCEKGEALMGFEARGTSDQYISAVQPVCKTVLDITNYVGGQGGQAHFLSCPEGYVAIGTAQKEHMSSPGSTLIGFFGLECGLRSTVEAGLGHVPDTDRIVVHGSFNASYYGHYQPAMREGLTSMHWPPGIHLESCNPGSTYGYAMTGLIVQSGAMVDMIRHVRCGDMSSSSTQWHWVGDGGTGGTSRTLYCPSDRPYVKGLYIRSGWLTDGFALACTD